MRDLTMRLRSAVKLSLNRIKLRKIKRIRLAINPWGCRIMVSLDVLELRPTSAPEHFAIGPKLNGLLDASA
jgi:hypothetical protein